ncbi:MAG TPA: hypothetical protein VEB65_02880 [Solirubrobacterales bacterium]|nr:hypothetical protein [Solirubrobacterales bacterium]
MPVGLLRDGRTEYAPRADLPIAPSDGLIVLAAGPAEARVHRPVAPAARTETAELALAPTAAATVRVLTLGWSPEGADLLDRLPASTEVTVLGVFDDPSAGPPGTRLRPGDPLDAELIAATIADERPASVIALGGCNGASDAPGAHARAALAALKVSRITSRPDLTIVVEQEGSESTRRLRSADPRIRVVSRAELVADALLQSSTDRPSLDAREALVLDERVALAEFRATAEEPVAFAEVYRQLLDQRAVPLALSRQGKEVDLLDPAAALVHQDDGLLVLRRNDRAPG